MIKAERGYIEGTSARKLDYDIYEHNPVLKIKKTNKTKNKAKFRLVLYIIILFSLAFTLIYRYAAITELNYKLVKAEKNYNDIINLNSRLKMEIEKSTDLDNIRNIAENKLGMQKPDRAQIVYVSVPKQDVTVVSGEYKGGISDKGNVFASIFDKVLEFLKLISG